MNLFLRLLFPRLGLNLQISGVPADSELPPLQPPHGDLPPSFWEQHGWAVVVVALLTLFIFALLIFWARRSMPAVIVPPDALARRDLEALRGQAEDGVLLMKVSGILRRYVTFACGLPPGELTSAELCRAIATHPLFSSDLAAAIADFFRQCDERKFSAHPPAPALGAVATALALVEKIDQRRRQQADTVSPPSLRSLPPPIPKSAAAPPS
jgi:hypothetical protein